MDTLEGKVLDWNNEEMGWLHQDVIRWFIGLWGEFTKVVDVV
jgi:hypothetical protein